MKMKMKHRPLEIVGGALAVLLCGQAALAQPAEARHEPASPRLTAVISDLHLGLGMTGGKWSETEDFRWQADLDRFLTALSERGDHAVDLIIAGDFLELWQPPRDFCSDWTAGRIEACDLGDMNRSELASSRVCDSPKKNLGYSVEAITCLARLVVSAHAADFEALSRFVMRGTNEVIVVPGNHDAALMVDDVWQIVLEAFPGECRSRVSRPVRDVNGEPQVIGAWSNGEILVEHGHQIGPEVNRFDHWPMPIADGHLERPWGELFVQRNFNEEERTYPLIDNLNPTSAGLKYRLQDIGPAETAQDLARFVKFSALDTSVRQKIAFFGPGDEADESESEEDLPQWDVKEARQRLGHRLVLGNLDASDAVAELLLDPDPGSFGEVLRGELDEQVNNPQHDSYLQEEEILQLCDQLAIRAAEGEAGEGLECLRADTELAYSAHKIFGSKTRTLKKHIAGHLGTYPDLSVFIYGHTHKFEDLGELKVKRGGGKGRQPVHVRNTGTFHRIIDKDAFEARAVAYESKAKALETMPLDHLPACYSVVLVEIDEHLIARAKIVPWIGELDAGSSGHRFATGPCEGPCAEISASCEEGG